MEEAGRSSQQDSKQQWRERLFLYLDLLFKQDFSAGAEYHDLQVQPYLHLPGLPAVHRLYSLSWCQGQC